MFSKQADCSLTIGFSGPKSSRDFRETGPGHLWVLISSIRFGSICPNDSDLSAGHFYPIKLWTPGACRTVVTQSIGSEIKCKLFQTFNFIWTEFIIKSTHRPPQRGCLWTSKPKKCLVQHLQRRAKKVGYSLFSHSHNRLQFVGGHPIAVFVNSDRAWGTCRDNKILK